MPNGDQAIFYPLFHKSQHSCWIYLPETNMCRELCHPPHGERIFTLLLARCILSSFKSLFLSVPFLSSLHKNLPATSWKNLQLLQRLCKMGIFLFFSQEELNISAFPCSLFSLQGKDNKRIQLKRRKLVRLNKISNRLCACVQLTIQSLDGYYLCYKMKSVLGVMQTR